MLYDKLLVCHTVCYTTWKLLISFHRISNGRLVDALIAVDGMSIGIFVLILSVWDNMFSSINNNNTNVSKHKSTLFQMRACPHYGHKWK